MSFSDRERVKELATLAIELRLKRLKVGEIEIEPDYTLADREAAKVDEDERVAETLAAQEVAAKLMDVTDEELLENPYAGLGDALKEVDNRPTKDVADSDQQQSMEGLSDE